MLLQAIPTQKSARNGCPGAESLEFLSHLTVISRLKAQEAASVQRPKRERVLGGSATSSLATEEPVEAGGEFDRLGVGAMQPDRLAAAILQVADD